MVLFKRKPVQYLNRPEIENDDQEVWLIPQTGEIFVEYEAYLSRMDFYKQHRFICQITGHSQLTFFDALKSELAGAQEVEEAFPEALKGPILRRVQFQTISRIDTLVDLIYEEFRADYYPGEAVTVHVVTGERLTGTVRDKTRFGSKQLPDGTVSPAFSRYFVSLDNRPTEEAVVDDLHITRDRKIFTKQVLRSFIKKTVTREAWTGAPWLVRPEIADRYHIDNRVPPHLRYESKAAERKQNQAQKKISPDYDGMVGSFQGNGQARLPELKPAPKSHKSKAHQSQLAKTQGPPPQTGPPFPQNFHPANFTFAPLQSLPPQPPPPPPVKYPIEDLQVAQRYDGPVRPPLKYFSQDTPIDDGKAKKEGNGIRMESVGPLLESWDTLNVYCEIFNLDSFTFDDFVEAMQFTSEDVDCELFVETHCAALKMLVNSEADGGKVNVQLPEIEEDSEDEEGDEESAAPSPTPEPDPKPKGRATRSSLAKAEAEAARLAELEAENPEVKEEESAEGKITNRAAEMQVDIGWIDRLRKRDFKNGGWQIIIVGLLHQLSKGTKAMGRYDELLDLLAPLNMDPTPETARLQYAKLDVNLRIKILQQLCVLTAETKAVRNYMEECSETMTGYRKEKIVFQRDRKQLMEELRLLNEERKILLPANLPPSPVIEHATLNGDTKMADVDEEVQDSTNDEHMDTDDDVHQGRSLRRGLDRAAERKRKDKAEKEKKEKAEAEAKIPKQSKQFTKLMKDIEKKQKLIEEAEKEIAILDNDLREADCPRTRVLGKDRFWNRYYWFERNGMPYGGLPTSSTAEAGYANGCIWVQGPDDLEREGYIDMRPDWQQEYVHKFNITVPDRKKMEEGPTSVFNAHQWGFYDEPEALDKLISWLDTRGLNEVKLHKELKLYRDRIAKNMEKRKEYLNPTEDKSVDSGNKRMSTRKKEQHKDHDAHRCLAWHNNMAIEELGHIHSEQPRARKPAKKAQTIVPVVEEERTTRSEAKSKKEKGLGRQGSRYNF
ncbi:ATP-utilizing chromatin assembly and remodelling N-terminal-domain-containing protein [Halenospora varia]|nr:ATP-utilizing chromatin assembly and remodelling N-terminal-domain-containing protein [Halenospora varia]